MITNKKQDKELLIQKIIEHEYKEGALPKGSEEQRKQELRKFKVNTLKKVVDDYIRHDLSRFKKSYF